MAKLDGQKERPVFRYEVTINLNVTGTGSSTSEVTTRLAHIEELLTALGQRVAKTATSEELMAIDTNIQAEINELNATVSADTDATNSIVTVLEFNTAKLDQLLASSSDPAEVVAAIRAANEVFKANTQRTAEKAAANTRG